MVRTSKLALIWGALAFLLASCGSNPVPDIQSYGWCASIDFSQPSPALLVPVGTQTGAGIQSVGGALSAIYTHSSIIEAQAIEAQFDIVYAGGGSRTIVAEFDAFGIEQSAQTSINSSISTAIGATAQVAGAGSTNASVVVVTDSDVTITIRRMRVAGNGSSPFGASLNCDEGNATATPLPTGTPPVFNLPSPTPSNTPTPSPTPTNTPTLTPTNTVPAGGAQLYISQEYNFDYQLSLGSIPLGFYTQVLGSVNHPHRVVGQYIDLDYGSFSPEGGIFTVILTDHFANLVRSRREWSGWLGYSGATVFYNTGYLPSQSGYTAEFLNNHALVNFGLLSPRVLINTNNDAQTLSSPAGNATYYHSWIKHRASSEVANVRFRVRFIYASPIPPSPTPTGTLSPTPTTTPPPSGTPLPSLTPLPSATPLPSLTPLPSSTPRPTSTPFPTLAVGTIAPTSTPSGTGDGSGGDFTENTWSRFGNLFDGLLNGIIGLFNWLWGNILGLFAPIIGLFEWLWGLLVWGWEFITGALAQFWRFIRTAWDWLRLAITIPQQLQALWSSTPATAPPGMPQCVSNPLGNNICAVYYILRFTLFGGIAGQAIIWMLVAVVDIAMFMSVLGYVKTIARKIRGVIQ